MVNIHRIHPESVQNARVEALPFGTRGGLAVEGYFPVDADYVIDVELAGRAREPHQLEITIDGERVELVTIGGEETPAHRIPNSDRSRAEAGGHHVRSTECGSGRSDTPAANMEPRHATRNCERHDPRTV